LMEAVKADGDWELVFPDTSDPEYDEVWDGDLEAWIAAGRTVQPYKTVKARELWNAIIESAWASAEPGVWFRERSNKMANSWYFNPLISTNPCVTGDTRIYTDQGLVPARELFDDETDIKVAIDGRFGLEAHTVPSTRVFMTGTKPVYKLQTKEGYSLRATADHRIMTPGGWVELQDLQPGDRIHILNRKGGFGREGSLALGRVLGWLMGDGTLKADRAVLPFFGGEKRQLAPIFAGHVNELVELLTAGTRKYPVGIVEVVPRDEARVQSERLLRLVKEYGLVGSKHRVPEVIFRGTEDTQRGFLQALFTADGSFQNYGDKGGSVRLASGYPELLEDVQQILLNFGIASRIYRDRRPAGSRDLPDSDQNPKAYHCRSQHELVISKHNLVTFRREIGFLLDDKQQLLEDYVDHRSRGPYRETFTATVDAVVADGVEDVFDLTESLTHSFVAGGVVVHNCGEQPLGAFSVCNLGAINLARFYDADKHDVAWDDLQHTVRYSVRFLDNVIDSTPYFFEENARVQGDERRIGLGTMGIAELMIRLGIRYGSAESVEFIDKVYQFITLEAYRMSIELAKEKGPFPRFDAEKFLQSGFMKSLPEDIRAAVREHGIRNVTLLTQAPTGTTGTMVNTSTGIEPFFSWVYYRKSRLGLHEEQVPLVKDWHEANPETSELPDYFVTAMELSPEEHIRVQAAFQRWIDSAISKTCNVPKEYTVEQVSDLYQYMYELGCKGGTIYRDGSRDEQVLMLKGDERAESEISAKAKKIEQVATPHRVYPRPNRLQGVTVNCQTPFGTAYVTMNSDEHGYPFEVFITAPGKAGSDLAADAEGLGRMISLSLRTTDPHNRLEMLKLIIDQLRDIGGSRSVGFGMQRVTSLPDSVARALEEQYFPQNQAQQLGLPMSDITPSTQSAPNPPLAQPENPPPQEDNSAWNGVLSGADICPSCRTISLIRAEGCRKCLACGYSEC
jgi:ribonucleoside-diphosphate reductase alpha chain